MKLITPNIEDFNSWTVDQMPTGFVMPGGLSEHYITGGWRSMRPVWNAEACTNCMLCWISCPDSSIIVQDGKMVGIDYDHCKGCGVCVHECRFGCLELIREDQADAAKEA
ncbi:MULTISPECIES: 4Fe-4S binding protein [unclassified Adlercreutzia]|uniref:4Fe-4S binding protein n=1 Tax=unclassified Adlercreutzia TaxID=2636013 RepID=UPI0013E9F11F|nr:MULTISPECIES: 4Fe-4S binding protein [unclassified Adlercreutzia]